MMGGPLRNPYIVPSVPGKIPLFIIPYDPPYILDDPEI
jgi:hypothetical protein